MNKITQLWNSVKSNPYFIAFEGAALGTLGDALEDALQQGKLDLTPAGWHKMLAMAVVSGATAVRALYRPPPAVKPQQLVTYSGYAQWPTEVHVPSIFSTEPPTITTTITTPVPSPVPPATPATKE